MRSILFSLFVVASFVSFGKSVDENTAKIVGNNFYKSRDITTSSQFSVIYKATSVIDGKEVTDFYVLSPGAGFIIVSGDDLVRPVLAFSADAPFDAANMPPHVAAWLDGYKEQINKVIKDNIAPSAATVNNWKELLKSGPAFSAAKTTVVPPLVRTRWGQQPYYNELCPFDASAGEQTITGCVATAMAQLMKYWSWPKRGQGSHSYHSPYGMLTANFGEHTYKWDSMPVALFKTNNHVATLMSDAGIGVNMNYGVDASGAWVLGSGNCTESAMQTYFHYKPTIRGEFRSSYDDTAWVHLIKAEIDAKRPIIYTGYGPTGGHCFLADGYIDNNFIHFNWGWGYTYDGFYIVEHLAPGSSDFTNRQEILVNIEPDSAAFLDVKDNNTVSNANAWGVYPNPAKNVINIDLQGTKANTVRIIDIAGRELKTVVPAKNTALVAIPVSDLGAGIYIVELHTSEGTERKKITVSE
ncbi:MAG: Peptidase family protein [Flavipsychrobacter sp.]|nr:Peptidase family protein [Flavipsychrobacter sp.]